MADIVYVLPGQHGSEVRMEMYPGRDCVEAGYCWQGGLRIDGLVKANSFTAGFRRYISHAEWGDFMDQLRRCMVEGVGEAKMFEHDERYKFEDHDKPGMLKLQFQGLNAVVTGKVYAELEEAREADVLSPYSILDYRFALDLLQFRESFSDLEFVQKQMQEFAAH